MSMLGKMVRVLTLEGMEHYARDSGLAVGDIGKVVIIADEAGSMLGVKFEGKPYHYFDGTIDEVDGWFAFLDDEVEPVVGH